MTALASSPLFLDPAAVAWRDARQGTGCRIRDHAARAGYEPVTKPTYWPARWFRDMRRPCPRCGADLPPPDPGWGGRPRTGPAPVKTTRRTTRIPAT